jgi:excisionase family DNA binding protein
MEANTTMMPRANRLYLTTGEVAAGLRVRPHTVRWLIRTQQLTAQRIGEEFLIERSDLAAFIDAHTIHAHPNAKGGGIE